MKNPNGTYEKNEIAHNAIGFITDNMFEREVPDQRFIREI
jgi:hypothetical protein